MKTPRTSFRLLAAILIFGILFGLFPLNQVFGQTQILKFLPVADSYVHKSNPSRNYGTRTSMYVDGSPTIRGYLRFNIRGLNGAKVTGAKLRLYVVDDSSIGFNVTKVSNTTWSETGITYNNAPAVGSVVGKIGSYGVNRWIEINLTGAVSGEGLVSLALTTPNNTTTALASRETGANAPQLVLTLGTTVTATATTVAPTVTATKAVTATAFPTQVGTIQPTASPIAATPTVAPTSSAIPFIAAGDNVDCNSSGGRLVSDMILNLPGTVQLLGDGVWGDATYDMYNNCFDPTYGRFKDRLRPATGNHEYHISGAGGYARYFGAQGGPAGKFYYSYNLGKWHIVVLNSNCSEVGGCQAGSVQEQWLKADLAANNAQCTIAVWHHPRYSSGKHGNNTSTNAFWQDLYAAGAELVLSGHDHNYERFAPQDASGRVDTARGMRQFVVGTGGIPLYTFSTAIANSEKQIEGTFGVLSLTLKDNSYDWKFIPAGGKTATDSGSGVCH